jgi:hypothetical protein
MRGLPAFEALFAIAAPLLSEACGWLVSKACRWDW